MFFNKYIYKLNPYNVVTHKAWEIQDSSTVLKLDWNEATIKPSPKVYEALSSYLLGGPLNWYPDVDNNYLRKKIAEYANVRIDQVEYFASSDALHEYIIRTFINPEDVITMIAPTYDNFRAAAESIGAKINYFFLDATIQFSFDVNKFHKHLEKYRPKIVYICNPNNPTGTLYPFEVIQSLLKQFNNVLFIIDEAYYEFSGVTCTSLLENENIVICRTFSKAFALASFRIGYAISSTYNIKGLRKIRNPKNISSYSQIAAIATLDDIQYMQRFVREVSDAKKEFIRGLFQMGIDVISSGFGNFVLVNFGESQSRVTEYLESRNIFIRNYSQIQNLSRFSRITIGTRQQMATVLENLKIFYNKA